MENKSSPSNLLASQTEKKVELWVEEMKADVQKVTWTTQEELLLYTKLVVAATLLIGFGVYLIDLFLQGTLSRVLGW